MRTALVHDWLTGMRGGEKVLERLAAMFPEAPIYTLFHHPGSVSAALEQHPIRTSFLQRLPIRQSYRPNNSFRDTGDTFKIIKWKRRTRHTKR